MGSALGPREKAIFSQTLAPLIKGLEKQQIIVELKNGLILFGKLTAVDCFMNLTMESVLMTKSDGNKCLFDFFFLQSKNLRYIRIPDHIPIKKTLTEQVNIVTGEKGRADRRRAKEKRANYLKKKQQKNMSKEVEEAFKMKAELDKNRKDRDAEDEV